MPIALQTFRVVTSAAAIAVLSRAIARRLNVPSWLFVAAGLHPIVLYYAGSARWYPYLLLAHALRAYAIWRTDRVDARTGAAFVGGSLLGSMAGYIDALFLVHDSIWFAARQLTAKAETRGDTDDHAIRIHVQRVATVVFIGALTVVGLRMISPLRGLLHDSLFQLRPSFRPLDAARWAALGVAGEAGMPFPWILSGLVCIAGAFWAYLALLRDRVHLTVSIWIASYTLAWLIACAFGVWHPRYSLMVWLLVAALLVRLALKGTRYERILCGLCFAHLAVVLGLAFYGRGFFKGDLNRLSADDCRTVGALESGLLVIPYPRLAALISTQCPVTNRVFVLPLIRVQPCAKKQLAGLAGLLMEHDRAFLLKLNVDSSLTRSQQRAEAFMGRYCTPQPERRFSELPHPWLRRDRPLDYRRYTLRPFVCHASD